MLLIDHTKPLGQRVSFTKDWSACSIGTKTQVATKRRMLLTEDTETYAAQDFAAKIIDLGITERNRNRIRTRAGTL